MRAGIKKVDVLFQQPSLDTWMACVEYPVRLPRNRNEDGNQKRRIDDPNTKNKEVNNRTKEGA